MESHLHEWLNLLLRWIHFIVGVAWIGASFYFNWLENNLERKPDQEEGQGDGQVDELAGNLWAIHGGGFYHLTKYKVGPAELPPVLHWFKWEAYATWLSGFCLLAVVYYFNARTFLIEPGLIEPGLESGLPGLTPAHAIGLGVAAVIGSWFIYDALCRSPLKRVPALLAACVFAALVLLAWTLSGVFSGRAAYIHIGAAIGTMMVGNVFFVIIPAQKEMVAALTEKRRPDPALGAGGALRSRHNNYLTLPVLFIMISAHFPSTYGHGWNWAVLALISIAGWLARHYFNIRRQSHGQSRASSRAAVGWLAVAFLLLMGVVWMTAPSRPPTTSAAVAISRVVPIIQSRCAGCHAVAPTQPGFAAPAAGLVLESTADIERNAARIFTAAVQTKTMPIGNLSGMTEPERALLAAWYHGLQAKPSTGADKTRPSTGTDKTGAGKTRPSSGTTP